MKLVTFAIDTPVGELRRVGALRKSDSFIVDLCAGREVLLNARGVENAFAQAQEDCPSEMLDFIKGGDTALKYGYEVLDFADEMAPGVIDGITVVYDPASVRLLTPLPRPNTVRCFSLSERHMLNGIKSMQDTAAWGDTKPSLTELPPEWYNLPSYYKTGTTEIYGPEELVPWPALTGKFDYELEIAVIIGKRGRNVPIEEGQDYIYGYSMYNDWSTRDFQNREMSINLGPGLCKDNASSIGPCIVTKDDYDLMSEHFTIRVNGEQWSSTMVDFYFPLEKLVEYVTQVQTIYPGDVFTTGTLPFGAGCELKKWIPEGGVIEFEADGMGILRNYIGKRGEKAPLPAAQRPYLMAKRFMDTL